MVWLGLAPAYCEQCKSRSCSGQEYATLATLATQRTPVATACAAQERVHCSYSTYSGGQAHTLGYLIGPAPRVAWGVAVDSGRRPTPR